MEANDSGSSTLALKAIMDELVSLAFHSGVTAKESVEMLKESYVDFVTRECGKAGRPTNISRTVLLTNLSRHDVKKIRQCGSDNSVSTSAKQKEQGLASMMREWFEDISFQDERGKQIPIPVKGDSGSLESLAKKYFSDVPVTAVCREVVDAEVAEYVGEDKVRALYGYFYPPIVDQKYIFRTGNVIADFVNTMTYNLTRAASEESRIEFRTVEARVAARHENVFRHLLELESEKLCQRIDNWLQDRVLLETGEHDECVRMGFGIYQIGSKRE